MYKCSKMVFGPFEYYFPSVFPLVGSDDENEENEIEMLIENSVIGKLIGKRGVVVESIRREYGASIKIYDKSVGSKRKVKIYGKYWSVECAKNEIERCIGR